MSILNSASKIVFIALALALIGLTWKGLIDPKDFVALTGMAFVYYFTKAPSTPTVPPIPPDTTDTK